MAGLVVAPGHLWGQVEGIDLDVGGRPGLGRLANLVEGRMEGIHSQGNHLGQVVPQDRQGLQDLQGRLEILLEDLDQNLVRQMAGMEDIAVGMSLGRTLAQEEAAADLGPELDRNLERLMVGERTVKPVKVSD